MIKIDGTLIVEDEQVTGFVPAVTEPDPPPPDPPPPDPEPDDLPLLEYPRDMFVYVVPDDGHQYWQVRGDQFNPRRGYKPRSIEMNYKGSLPMTVRMWGEKDTSVAFDYDQQFFLFDCLCRSMGGKLARDADGNPIMIRNPGEFPYPKVIGGYMSSKEMEWVWLDFTANHKFWTDGNSANENGHVDHVTEINLGDPYGQGDMKFTLLTCGGNLVRQVLDVGTIVEVACLNANEPFPPIDEVFEDKALLHLATQETLSVIHESSSGRPLMWRESPFPHIQGDAIDGAHYKIGTAMLMIGQSDTILMNKDELIKMEPGQVYSPHIRRYPPIGLGYMPVRA